jgi:beta-lactamase superfamily II metal-dependent hydrolase
VPPKKKKARPASAVKAASKAKKAKIVAKATYLVTDLANRHLYLPATHRPPGNRGDGTFHIDFIGVGQGDCTIITTPEGRVVMIDCGSKYQPDLKGYFHDRVWGNLTDPKFLQHELVIDVLILTHADADHHNALEKVLDRFGIVILKVYCSGEYSDYTSGHWLLNHVNEVNEMVSVVVNRDPAAPAPYKKAPITMARMTEKVVDWLGQQGIPKSADGVDVESADGIRVLEEPDCEMTIIAANVHHDYGLKDSSSLPNRGSAVLHIRAFDHHILIMGDATICTETYLRNVRSALIKKTTFLRIGHHGSIVTSSLQTFVDDTAPKVAIASADADYTPQSFSHPHWPVLDSFLTTMENAGYDKLADDQEIHAHAWDAVNGEWEAEARDVSWNVDVTVGTGSISYTLEP